MLPSTGYFKALNCPFYDSGLCERPYCHFRHVKRDSQNISGDGIESGAMLQKLVSEAVKKVLEHTEASGGTKSTSAADAALSVSNVNTDPTLPSQKATYNPTPIAELKKINNTDIENSEESIEQRRRHIPVPYTPRKPSNLPSKRPIDSNDDGECKPFVYVPPPLKYLPGSADSIPLDIYTPAGAIESNEKYLPGSEKELQEYKPLETKTNSNVNYVPSDKNFSKKQVLEYKPTKVNSKNNVPRAVYQPTPRSQVPCFSSDEDEPESKKRKTSDLNGLDDLGAEFDILGQILDEEKPADPKVKDNKKEVIVSENGTLHPVKKSNKSTNKDDKRQSDPKERDQKDKINEKKSDDKKSSDKKSSHKSSSKDRDREKEKNKEKDKTKDKQREKDKDREKEKEKLRDKDKRKEKVSSDKNRSSSSKSSDRQSKNYESLSKNSDKSTKQSSRNGNDKKREKDDKTKHKSSKEKRSKDKNESKAKDKKVEKNISDDELNVDDSIHVDDELCEEISDSDEEAIALECKRIFEAYIPSEKPKISEQQIGQENNSAEEEYIPTKKRISHTADKNIKIIHKEPIKPDYKVSAAQKMAERLAKVRDYHAAKAAIAAESAPARPEQPKVMFSQPATPSSNKIRIAHVPYASTMMNAKKTIPPPTTKATEPSTSTAIQTLKRGTQRVAHMPNEKFIDRPGVLEPLASKIPANIRSTYLNMMIDECLKIYITATDAYARAQHEELNTSKKCKTIQIYKNSAVLTVSRLRKECLECKGVKKSGLDCTALQKVSGSVTGTSGNAGSWSIESKNRRGYENPNEYRGSKLYENIQKWVLTEEQLRENGFPRPHPIGERGRATIYSQNKGKPPKGFIRNCCRCKQDFTVDKKGFSLVKEECVYHPNRKYRFRGEVKYQCCSQDGMSDGCCVAPCHVYEYVDYENLRGFVTTMAPERVMDDYGVYSLDCEMCYTTHGLDLTRITVIDSTCKVVYETLIRPLHPIVDYNTRYSGITEEHMTDVKTTLLEVQATLLSMFNSKTILVGHSLESDCKALKLIHDTVIDTSVLFPHKMGPPFKRALRNLSSEYLKKIIQNSVEGHDSAEDATVCMELIHFKLKEDLKTR